jgi:DNA-binding CsgD family transcriptional regulator
MSAMPEIAFLQARFNLTPAEARLVLRLMAGDSLKSAAKALAIEYEMARNDLKAIFDKTGTRRQMELVILAIQAMEMMPGGPDGQPYRSIPAGTIQRFVKPKDRP